MRACAEMGVQDAWDEGDRLFEEVYLSEDRPRRPPRVPRERTPRWKGCRWPEFDDPAIVVTSMSRSIAAPVGTLRSNIPR